MSQESSVTGYYPERGAGGYTRYDGTVQFYERIHALLDDIGPPATVLDFGAGRGASFDSALPVHRRLLDLRPRAARVIGVDIDDTVRSNPLLTEAIVIQSGDRLPLADDAVDLVIADHVFEHVRDPTHVASELARIVRAGGWICARTPNRFGYIGIAGRMVPNRLHRIVLRRLQPIRQPRDVFPSYYRFNTRRALAHYFPSPAFVTCTYGWEPEPAYAADSLRVARVFDSLRRVTPEAFRPILLVFVMLAHTKREQPDVPRRPW